MRELLIVGLIGGCLCLLSGVWFLPWEALYIWGVRVTAAGVLFGVPTGILYHVGLYRALKPRGALPPRWYWRPIPLNRKLESDERFWPMLWCYLGGLGFVVICLGLLMVGAAFVLVFFRGV